jgi:serine/threonine protein kinase
MPKRNAMSSSLDSIEGPPEARPATSEKGWGEKYTKDGSIAEGGLGRVLRVLDRFDGTPLALKEPLFDDIESRRRFRREVEIQQSIEHKNVMPILDAGDDWFVMPIAEATLAEKAPELYELEVVAAFEQAVAGLQAAHAKGLVHRDVKPENLLLLASDQRPRRWVVSDFGLVRRPSGNTTGPPTAGFVGTPGFCSPEQLAGVRELTAASDVYSLGRTLTWVLCGRVDVVAPEPWRGLSSRMCHPVITARPAIEDVIEGLGRVRQDLRRGRRDFWGKGPLDVSDDEAEVLGTITGCLNTPQGAEGEMAFLSEVKDKSPTLLPGGIWIQLKALEEKGLVIQESSWTEAWAITVEGWKWLRSNQHRLRIKKSVQDDDIPF